MTIATNKPLTHAKVAKGDVRMIYEGRTWAQFKALQEGFENSGVRLSYYDETVEILRPGKAHEVFTGIIGFLIETFLFQQGVNFVLTGSMTQENETASAQADRSYEIEDRKLSIEINFTSGSLAKLKRYRALGIDEVWIWNDGVLEIYQLLLSGYQKVERSAIPALSELDLDVMQACILVGETSTLEAGKKLLAAHSNEQTA